MIAYLDASILVSAFQQDGHSERVDAWFARGHDFVLSSWAIAEMSSAFSVQVRMKRLTQQQRRAVENKVDEWLTQRKVVHPAPADYDDARSLMRADVRLRAPDALHLAIARRLGLDLATLDLVLAAAASDAGLDVVSP